MPRLTVSLDEDTYERLEKEVEADEFRSKSAAVQHYVDRGFEAEKLERELQVAESRADDLRRQMNARDDVEEKVDVLAKRLEEQEGPTPPFFVQWWQWWKRRRRRRAISRRS
jgi:Arc/MetJ-type ribon-helix-helix transcriptional regulator